MTDIETLMTDPAREVRGVRRLWRDGIYLTIASLNGEAYLAPRRECLRSGGDRLRELEADSPEVLDVLAPALARHILIGWEGITDSAKAPVPYTEAKALELLLHPRLRHLRRFVLEAAGEEAAYLARKIESAEGD